MEARKKIQELAAVFASLGFAAWLLHQKPSWWLPICIIAISTGLILFVISAIMGYQHKV